MSAIDIAVNFLGNASSLSNASNQGGAAVSKFSDRTKRAASIGIGAVAGLATAWVGSIKAGLDGLKEGEEAESSFAQALKTSSKEVRASSDAIMKHAEAIQLKTKFTYEDALATGSFLAGQDGVKNAVRDGVIGIEQLTDISLNLATIQGIDGPSAAAKLSKALAAPSKSYALLRKMGISLTAAEQKKIAAWEKSGDVASAQTLILAKLEARTKGAAEAAGNTMTGKIERAKNAFGEFQEGLAASVLPTLTRLLGVGTKITGWLASNPGKVKVLVIVLGALAAVIGTVSAAIKLWSFFTKIHTAIMWALNTAVLANPLVGLAVLLAAVAVAVVIAYKKSDTFRAIVQALWAKIKAFGSGAAQIFKDVAAAAAQAVSWIKDKFSFVGDALKLYVDVWWTVVSGVFNRIKDAVTAVGDTIKSVFQAAFDAVKWAYDHSGVSQVVDALGKVGGIAGKVGGGVGGLLGHVGLRAAGGPVMAGRAYVVGERGPELMVPSRSGTVVPNRDMGGGAQEVHVYIGDRELTDLVRVEVREGNRKLKLAATAGALRAAPGR